ncbi:hypothetical protein FOA52_014153 [Chlamydomonas sp. UWO 241]|nr:hypothetical protein FOA52_014153 [Chlamydomonas sp. UWO 241]
MHADVRLHVRVCAPSPPPGDDPDVRVSAPPPDAAKCEQGDQSDPAEVAVPSTTPYARSWYVHTVVLASQSEYYKGRLGQDSSRFKPDVQGGSDSGGGSRIAFETVEVVEQEEDVEAMDELLRTFYGVTVATDGETVATDVPVLLRASCLADQFLVDGERVPAPAC